MKVLVGALNKEKALVVGAFTVIVKTSLRFVYSSTAGRSAHHAHDHAHLHWLQQTKPSFKLCLQLRSGRGHSPTTWQAKLFTNPNPLVLVCIQMLILYWPWYQWYIDSENLNTYNLTRSKNCRKLVKIYWFISSKETRQPPQSCTPPPLPDPCHKLSIHKARTHLE